jgi:hypothetical protein
MDFFLNRGQGTGTYNYPELDPDLMVKIPVPVIRSGFDEIKYWYDVRTVYLDHLIRQGIRLEYEQRLNCGDIQR